MIRSFGFTAFLLICATGFTQTPGPADLVVSPTQPIPAGTGFVLNDVAFGGSMPFGVTVDETNDRVVVGDLTQSVAYRYDRGLNFLDTIPAPSSGSVTGIAATRDGSERLYWIEADGAVLFETDLDGTVIESFPIAGGSWTGLIGGLCYRESTDTLIFNDVLLDEYFEIDRTGALTGFSFDNPDGFIGQAFGNGVSHDASGGFRLITGQESEEGPRKSWEVGPLGNAIGIRWFMTDPDIGIFDPFVNGHVFTPSGGTTGFAAEYVAGNGTNRVIEIPAPFCPTNSVGSLACEVTTDDVELTWTNMSAYSSIDVLRDGVLLTTLPGSATEFVDAGVPGGNHGYVVRTTESFCEAESSCLVSTELLPAGQDFTDLVIQFPETLDGAFPDVRALRTTLEELGRRPFVMNGMPTVEIMSEFDVVWVPCGTSPSRHVLTFAEGAELRELVEEHGVSVYLSGGTIWSFDPPTPFDEVDGVADSGQGLVPSPPEILGVGVNTSLDFSDLDLPLPPFSFTGTVLIGTIEPDEPEASTFWEYPGPGSGDLGVFYNPGSYRVICTTLPFSLIAEERTLTLSRFLETPCEAPTAPENLQGTSTLAGPEITFINNGPYDEIEVIRNQLRVAVIPGGVSSFVDTDACAGYYEYRLRGISEGCGFISTPTEVYHNAAVTPWASTTTPVAIPDGGSASDTLTVTAPQVIDDLDVIVVISHPNVGELSVDLTSPDGTTLRLHAGFGDDANIFTRFDDEGFVHTIPGLSCGGCEQQVAGPGVLADFDGANAEGTWTLTVEDEILAGSGDLVSWTLATAGALGCDINAPENVTCEVAGLEVQVRWDSPGPYTLTEVYRDGILLDTLPGDPGTFTDPAPVFGSTHTYRVRGIDDGPSPCCAAISAPCELFVQPFFIRGDVNGDGAFSGLVDALFLLNFQFVPGSATPPCLDAADANDDGQLVALVDAVVILNTQFVPGSPPLPAPFPICGPDADQALGCSSSACP